VNFGDWAKTKPVYLIVMLEHTSFHLSAE